MFLLFTTNLSSLQDKKSWLFLEFSYLYDQILLNKLAHNVLLKSKVSLDPKRLTKKNNGPLIVVESVIMWPWIISLNSTEISTRQVYHTWLA